MQIDWFTVVAEIVNFLILVFLLKKVLYDRIIDIADAREEDIANRYADVEEKQEDAAAKQQKYQEKRREIEEKRTQMLAEAEDDAEEKRHALIASAREEVDAQKSKWLQGLRREQETFLRQLAQETGEQVSATARQVLQDLADADVERQVVDVFVSRLKSLDETQREEMAQQLPQQKTAVIHSAFDLSTDAREALTATIHNEFGDVPLRFERKPELICGLALRVNGRQLAWNVDSYLETLTARTEEQLHDELRQLAPDEADDDKR